MVPVLDAVPVSNGLRLRDYQLEGDRILNAEDTMSEMLKEIMREGGRYRKRKEEADTKRKREREKEKESGRCRKREGERKRERV